MGGLNKLPPAVWLLGLVSLFNDSASELLYPLVPLYLAVVLDLFSRQVIGWSMQPRMVSELAINALMMAVWRRQPRQQVIVHSDQGSQFSSYDWQYFLRAHNLVASQSLRGNCHDN